MESMIGSTLIYEVRIPACVKIYILPELYTYYPKRIIASEFIMFIIFPIVKNLPKLNDNT